MRFSAGVLFGAFTLLMMVATADDQAAENGGLIKLTADKAFIHVMHDGRSVKVQRVQDQDYELNGYFAKTARKCPPFCIRPVQVDPRVATVGEIEVFDFMETRLRDGEGMLIDSRTPEWFKRGTIPGSINIPFTDLTKGEGSMEMEMALELFGVIRRVGVGTITRKLEALGLMGGELKTDNWDFSKAKELVIWCNGPACGQSPRAIKGLLKVGYPPEKLKYYRGGMQLWQLWGLTTVIPEG